MSWSFRMAGMPKNVARDLRALKNNQYADPQRDTIAETTAVQVETMSIPSPGYGVLVTGSGHNQSNFNVQVEFVQISEDPTETVESPAPTEAAPATENGDSPTAVQAT